MNRINNYSYITECQVFLTRRCNLNCGYCNLTKKPLPRELKTSEWKEAFSRMEMLGIQSVKLLGGEPTILEDLEELITFICKKTKLKFALLSNSLFGDERILSLVNAGLQGYFASIDSLSSLNFFDENGEKKSNAGYRVLLRMKELGVPVLGANVVITPQNLQELPELVLRLSDDGIWVNLCPIIFSTSNSSLDWQFRTYVKEEARFSTNNKNAIDAVMQKLIDIKKGGGKISVPESYIRDMSKYAINCDWKCTYPVQLRVDADGALMLCGDLRGEVAKKYNLLSINEETYRSFINDWLTERKEIVCPGCYWSCYLGAQYNIQQSQNEFFYGTKPV